MQQRWIPGRNGSQQIEIPSWETIYPTFGKKDPLGGDMLVFRRVESDGSSEEFR